MALLADAEFHATDRNRRFLQFVAEETLDGRSAAIKAYSIAVDVFGRSESFDPSTDPIVRIEATRLRASLSRYYDQEGRGRGVRIDLPKGAYVPSFSRICPGHMCEASDMPTTGNAPDAAFVPAGVEAPPPAVGRASLVLRGRTRPAWIGVAALACVALLASFMAMSGSQPASFSLKPVVSLAVAAADGSQTAQADSLRDAMQIAISQFQTVRIATARLPETADGTEDREATYRIEVKYAATDFDRGAWWQLVDAASGEAIQSGVERVFVNARTAGEAEAKLAGAMAVELVGGHGAIATAEISRDLAEPALGYGCVLRGALALEGGVRRSLDESRTCLERSLELRPNDTDVQSTLAQVLLRIDPPEAPTLLGPNALLLAADAVRLNPFSDRASGALMAARFRNGQVEAALMAGRRAMDLNPNNGAISAKLGSMLFRLGRWDEALKMIAKAQDVDPTSYPEIDLTRAMDAYRRGDYRDALLLVGRVGDLDCFCASVLRVATLGQLGMADEAKVAAAKLRQDRRQFERDYRVAMSARHFDASLIDGLQAGLVKAGMALR